MKTTKIYLEGMAGKMGLTLPQSTESAAQLENNTVVETSILDKK